jgi:anti-sigma regulatory factor (Ser/Thr protein kinase)
LNKTDQEQVDWEDEQTVRLSPRFEMVGSARHFVSSALRRWGVAQPFEAELLTSEAVTNAVEHADTDYVEVSVGLAGGRVRVGVRDADPTRPRISLDAGREGGFGLRLIQTLSQDWGVAEIHDDGKRVWFELELPNGDTDPA